MINLVCFVLISGLLGFALLVFYTFKVLSRGWSIKQMFKDFNRKIWMTLSLGSLFFGLYLLLVMFTSYMVQRWGSESLFFAYQNPIQLLYGGLWLFIYISLSIYLARMFVKYVYLTRGKDN